MRGPQLDGAGGLEPNRTTCRTFALNGKERFEKDKREQRNDGES